MADSKRPQNNTIEFLTKLTKLFQSGPRIRHKIPKDITGKRTPEVMNALHSGQYLSNRDPYIYNQADRFYRYEDFAIMEFTPIIAAALDVYASAVASLDENRRSIIVRSKNPKIKAILYSLFMDIMNLNVNLYPWARNLVKYGDFFSYLRIDPNHGIIGVDPIPMDGIERVEKLDPKTGEKEVVFKVNLDGVGELKAHQVAHFRLPFNDQFFPYGTCLAWDTKVDTEHGKKQICDITTDDLVWCFDRETQTRKLSRVLDTVHSGAKECFRFVTEHGYYVDASLEHRIMVQDAGGFTYKPADEIAVGDLFVVESDTGFKTVSVILIEPVGKQEVYDIHVEDDNHNFYANGIVVHNSILDPARKIWRMLCADHHLPVWTANGYKEIQHLQIGDEVYAYTENGIVKTKVKNVWNTGAKPAYKIRTRHQSITTSEDHRFLLENGEYKAASELVAGKDRLVFPVRIDGNDAHVLNVCPDNYRVKLSHPVDFDGNGIMGRIHALNLEMPSNTIHKFLSGKSGVTIDDAVKLASEFGFTANDLRLHYGPCKFESSCTLHDDFSITFTVDKEMAKLFGFLLGDGWANWGRVGYAMGTDEAQNEYYSNLIEQYFKSTIKVSGRAGTNSRQANIYLKEAEFILKSLGFIHGFANKIVPEWVWSLSLENRRAFIRGIFDADGSDNDGRLALSNYDLIQGVHLLAQQSGIPTNDVKVSRKAGKQYVAPIDKVVDASTSYRIYLNMNEDSWFNETHYHVVTGIECEQESEMYDIEVEHEVHNFVANGIVTHNCLLEDAMMVYRIVRAPERRIFKIDVGNIPPESVEAFMEEQQNRMRRQIVVDDSTGRLDLRYSALPVWSKSPIPLLDGRTITIEQLAKEYDAGNENWVYSVQDETQEVVPGKVVWCGKNYTAERLIKVWLDDNSWIMTAPEHPFVLRDGSNKRADELNAGDALMPFYQKISGEKDMKIVGYPMVYSPGSEKYVFSHRMVADNVLRTEKLAVKDSTDWDKNKNMVVHHRDFNKMNASPSNLQWMGNVDHYEYHASLGKEKMEVYNQDPEFQAKRKAGNARYLNEEGGREAFLKVAAEYNNSDLHASHNPIRAKAMTEHWADDKKAEKTKKKMRIQFTQECFEELVRVFCAVDGKTNADGMCAALSNDTAFMAALQSANAENNRTESKALHRHNVIEWIREYSNYTDFRPFRDACLLTKKGFSFDEVMRDYTDIIELDRDSLYQKAKALGVPGYSGLIKDKQKLLHATVSHVAMIRLAMIQNDGAFMEVVGYKNHKVLRIEEIAGSEDVYCMTVVGPNGEDDRHNFAVKGLVSHNDELENVETSCSVSGCFVRNSLESDYFVPVRGNVGTEIDTLQGGTWSDGIQDIEYLQANLFAALRVPKPYLNFMDSADASKTALTEMSMIFSDHVRRIQCAILDELTKVAMIHLMFFGFDQEDMMDFELDLASSSRLAQQQTMEIYRQKFEILSGAPEDIPRRLLYKKIMGWDDDDIEEMTKDKIREAKLMGILKKLSDGDFEGAAGGMGGFGGGFDSGGGGDDFDLGGGDDLGGDTRDLGGDDLGGSEDIGGDTGGGIEPTGGSGGAESEVEDLFQGPFDPKGQSVFRTPDDVEEFERRRNQAQDILRQAIAISPMDFLIHGNPEDEEDAPKKDRHGRTKGEPVARRTQDRERAPGAGRPIEPGHSPRITGKDRNGSGRRHVAVATGNNSTSTRYHNDLIKPDRDSFKVAQENRAGLSKEYKDALNSLSKSFGRAALLEANTGVDDLDAALSSWSEAQKGQETAKKDGEMKKGAGIPPKKSLSPSELRQQRALADQDKAVKDALTKVQKAVVDKDKEKAASTETTEEEPETTTVNTKLTITSNEG